MAIDTKTGLMEVTIDGKIEHRSFTVEMEERGGFNRRKLVPSHDSNERVMYLLHTDIPTIVKVAK
jgi:hypothetical protein